MEMDILVHQEAYGVPETFIIDGEGKIILRHVGPIDFLSDYLVP